jgi:hypothetical protein
VRSATHSHENALSEYRNKPAQTTSSILTDPLVKRFHPDLFPSGSEAQAEAECRMREINVAYAALSNARKRASYDETLRQQAFYKEPKPEHCQRCGEPTLYWHLEQNVGLCESCGRSPR